MSRSGLSVGLKTQTKQSQRRPPRRQNPLTKVDHWHRQESCRRSWDRRDVDELQVLSYSSQYVFVCDQRMVAGMGVGGRLPLNEKSSQLCCRLWVDLLPEDKGKELLSIERLDSPDGVGKTLATF